MNAAQLKYARERASNTHAARKAALELKHTVPAITLTCEERLRDLKEGKFKSDAKKASGPHWWYQCVTFTAERPRKFDQKAFDKDVAALKVTYDALIGELVLGDNEVALELLKAFEAAA